MAKKTDSSSRSEEVRKLLRTNPDISAKDALASLAEHGVHVTSSLFYFIKGKMLGRKSRKSRRARKVSEVAVTMSSTNGDALKTILKVKGWANEVGGLKKLKALVDALSE